MAYVESRYYHLSDFPGRGIYVFLNERISRTGALLCLCEDKSNEEKSFEIILPSGEST